MTGPYINDSGYEVPKDTILVVPHSLDNDGFYKDILQPLKGEVKRDWFNSHFYYCLPLNIGNQYGFIIKSLHNFEAIWFGGDAGVDITFLDDEDRSAQLISNHFGSGIITVQNLFAIKTPPGINIMTIQPPNMFVPGCAAMTGVVETDQIRRDFTFNLKITVPNYKVKVKKGDPLGAFIPIPRYFVDSFEVKLVTDVFDKQLHNNEVEESKKMGEERSTIDVDKPHLAGRRYFNGIYTTGERYIDHQKKIK